MRRKQLKHRSQLWSWHTLYDRRLIVQNDLHRCCCESEVILVNKYYYEDNILNARITMGIWYSLAVDSLFFFLKGGGHNNYTSPLWQLTWHLWHFETLEFCGSTFFVDIGLSHIVSCHKDHIFNESSWHDTWFLQHRYLLTHDVVIVGTLSGRIYYTLQWVYYWYMRVWCDAASYVWLISCDMNTTTCCIRMLHNNNTFCVYYL